MKKYNILFADYYLGYARYLKDIYTDKRFNCFMYNEDEVKKFKTKKVNMLNIQKFCKKHNIDLIIALECSINNFIYKPFSQTAKELSIPFVSLFDGIIDHPYANSKLTILQKFQFGIQELTKKYFLKSILLSIFNLGPINYYKYTKYNLSQNKNRYLEDNVTNFINGDILFEMYPQLRRHKNRFEILGLLQMDSLIKQKFPRTQKNTVTILGQPWRIDNLISEQEFKGFLNQIKLFAKNNQKFKILYRPHPKEPKGTYSQLKQIPNIRVTTKDQFDLNEQIAKSEFVVGLFSSAIANAIWMNKKLIIFNFANKVSNSIYNQKIFFKTKRLQNLKLNKVNDFYQKINHKKEFHNFYKKISYFESNSTAIDRLKQKLIKLIENNGNIQRNRNRY